MAYDDWKCTDPDDANLGNGAIVWEEDPRERKRLADVVLRKRVEGHVVPLLKGVLALDGSVSPAIALRMVVDETGRLLRAIESDLERINRASDEC